MPTPETPQELELLESVRKRRRACELRLNKVAYRVIADELGVSIGTVRSWVKESIVTMLPQEEAEVLRTMEAAGYDRDEHRALECINMLATQAARKQEENENIAEELEAIRRWQEHVNSLRKQRALLLGLNRPVKVEHALTVRSEFDAEVEALVSELAGGGKLLSTPDNLDVGD